MADLTTLDAVKAYLAITSNGQDALIASLIKRESRAIELWTGRTFSPVTQTAKPLNGTGTSRLTLPDFPVVSVASVADGLTPILPSSDGVAAGYTFDENRLYLTCGGRFTRGLRNIFVSWNAGFTASEAGVIPQATGNASTSTITPQTDGAAYASISATNDDTAAPLTKVSGTPTTGQYAFASGGFSFAAADHGANVTMHYYFIPGPVAQACIEMIGLDLKQRDNLGINSKTLGGETISYSSKGMTDSVKEMLMPYRRQVIA